MIRFEKSISKSSRLIVQLLVGSSTRFYLFLIQYHTRSSQWLQLHSNFLLKTSLSFCFLEAVYCAPIRKFLLVAILGVCYFLEQPEKSC